MPGLDIHLWVSESKERTFESYRGNDLKVTVGSAAYGILPIFTSHNLNGNTSTCLKSYTNANMR